MASGVTLLDPGWVRGELPCTKAGMRGQPCILDLIRVLHHDGASFFKLTIVRGGSRERPIDPKLQTNQPTPQGYNNIVLAACFRDNYNLYIVHSDALATTLTRSARG